MSAASTVPIADKIADAPAKFGHLEYIGLFYSALAIVGMGAGSAALLASQSAQSILFPLLFITLIYAVFTSVLFIKDHDGPLLHAGFFAASTAYIYICLPAVFFLASGQEWSDLSDQRLVTLDASVSDVAHYVRQGVIYLSGLCITYLAVIWSVKKIPGKKSEEFANRKFVISLSVVFACFVYRQGVERIYGVSLSKSNVDLAGYAPQLELPLFLAQLTHNVLAIQQIAKIATIVALVSMWRLNWARAWLVLMLGLEIIGTVALLGSRTDTALLLLATIISFHCLVRPIKGPQLAISGGVFLVLILAYGYLRDHGGSVDLSSANEFQVLMATAIHVKSMVNSGLVAPFEVLWSELLMLIPQQLISVEKIDPSNWYLQESGLLEYGGGYMFGVISQAEIGAGAVELFARGCLLATVLGLIHRLYVKRVHGFVGTVAYIWLLTTIYYSYRATTFYWLTFVIYRLAVFVILFKLLETLVSHFKLIHAEGEGAKSLQ